MINRLLLLSMFVVACTVHASQAFEPTEFAENLLSDSTQMQSTQSQVDSATQVPGGTVDTTQTTSQNEQQPATPEVYTSAQNQAFEDAIEIEMAPNVRFKLAIQETIMDWQLSLSEEPDEWEQVMANLNIPRAQLQPSGREQVFRDYAMNQAKDVDSPVPTSPGFKGLEIPLSDIGQFLGLTEDVSPTISYEVTFATNVAVVIYGADARKVADVQRPLFRRPGKYVLTWNLKDNSGRPMPAGDYIAEVQIGLDATSTTHIHVIRKKIVIR